MLKIVEETAVLSLSNGLFSPLENYLNQPCFVDVAYTLRLLRYTEHLRHLLDNPPCLRAKPFSDVGDEKVYQDEMIDHYLQVVGELINGLYELSREK